MIRAILLLFSVMSSIPGASQNPDPEWTWIHGKLDRASRQTECLEFATRMHGFYQERGFMVGPLVAEEELESWPEDHTVVIGPLEAFEDPNRFGVPLEVEGDEVTIGGQTLGQRRTGIYLTNEEKTRCAYTGLSLDGFRDIFTVPTGDRACTVTRGQGRISHQGDYGPDGLTLEPLPFLDLYPSEAELRELHLPEGALEVEPVMTEPELDALTPEFATWLDGFVDGQRVLFFGESHWNQGVNLLFHRIVEHLLETGDLRAVFLEVNYSYSAFYDYFVTEPDEDRAREFLETRLHPMVSSTSTLELLELLRAWNFDHPEAPVRVGCLDMEWGTQNVMQRILQPYFRKLDGNLTLPVVGTDLRERLLGLLEEAQEKELVGDYPFLTPEYIDTVIVNLWDTIDIEDLNVDRQRGIIRNMTEFNGELLEEGLVLFKGGGWHALKSRRPGELFYRDATYLHEVHPPTRGKVVTLHAQGMGYSFAEIADLNLGRRMPSATKYNGYVNDFQRGLKEGYAELDAYYLLDRSSLSLFDRLMIKTGYESKSEILRIASVDWKKLTEVHGEGVREGPIGDYDAMVYVLRSGIEVMRPRSFEWR